MRLLDTLEPFSKEAEALSSANQPDEIIFSGPTYQLRFSDGGEPSWVFVQLDDHDEAKDIFCQGEACATTPACRHMAAAYLAIFKNSSIPLHKRFERSPFFALFYPLALAHPISMQKRETLLRLAHGIVIKSSQQWQSIVEEILSIPPETEETSIKFSSLTHKELEDWKSGILSPKLHFELSPLSDLAKYLFQYDENHPCLFHFEEAKRIPKYIRCSWELALECRLPCPQDLSALLDTLSPHRTTPRVEPLGGKKIQTISFSSTKNTATITLEESCLFDLSKSIPIGPWNYLPAESFVKTVPNRLTLSDSESIISFLEIHLPRSKPLPLSYHIDVSFEGLLITPFIRKPGDLQGATFFDSWIWRKKEGFQRIEPLRIPTPSFFVPSDELTEFVHTYHHLLSSIPGFAFHERQPKERISFSVEKSGELIFHSSIDREEGGRFIQVGDWIYVENEGFFLKSGEDHFPFDTPILPHHVSSFIRDEYERLQTIPHFFAEESPLTDFSLQIRALSERKIELKPRYKWADRRFEPDSRFYDEYCYVRGVGFSALPELLTAPTLSRTIHAKDRDEWDRFFLEILPSLKSEYPCEIDPLMESPKELRLICQNLEAKVEEVAKTPQFWEVQFYWESHLGAVSAETVYRAFKRSERFLITPAGLLDLTHERFGWLASVPSPTGGKQYQIKTTDFLKISAHDELSFASGILGSTSDIISRLLTATPPTPPDLTFFTGVLRPYQMRGVEWLWHLYLSGLSGLLCDDMGVGKTHQAMALLAAVTAHASNEKTRFLVICPTSLLWHWADKLAKTMPWLKIFTYVGAKRSLEELLPDHTLFLTTYGLWRNDIKTLRHLSFDVAIFDELQIAKSHVSQIWASLCHVKADMRLGLTGTPIENQLRELRALFDLVLPGYIPPDLFMRDPAHGNRNLLSRYARPFILRRRKQDVLPDLPPKTEDIFTSQLIGDQKDLYRQIVTRQGLPILHQLQDEHTPIPYMHIFALISALKQICNHPASYLRDVENYQRYESGKWEAFQELLEEAQESGQKVVVFSQFLSMLDIIGKHLTAQNISYTEIRGSTKERGAAINTFQNDPSCLVFLGSLQAAGLGIDLTAASIVIHYDRWWNAARENQATDRVHRIGQTRGVLVYKLMTANTIEERIDLIISHKAQLFEDVIRYDDHQMMKTLNRAELLELFHDLDQC